MIKLGDYFYQDFSADQEFSPKKLQQAVMFSLMYFTCRRGRENLHEMTPQTYKLFQDGDGLEYIMQDIDELDKNHQQDSMEVANKGKMVATPGEKQNMINFQR